MEKLFPETAARTPEGKTRVGEVMEAAGDPIPTFLPPFHPHP
jgi:hypothetical protein